MTTITASQVLYNVLYNTLLKQSGVHNIILKQLGVSSWQ